jgi:hypothetical protein
MNCPRVYRVNELVNLTKSLSSLHPTLGWVAARPMGWQGLGLFHRLRAAWLVFTGKADAVRWFE